MMEKVVRFFRDGEARQAAPAADPAPIEGDTLEERVISALRTVYDPEIPVNIYDLGLIYDIDLGTGGQVDIRMTLTAPACPVAGIMPRLAEEAVRRVEGVDRVNVELVWDPPWSQDRMTDEARLTLGMF